MEGRVKSTGQGQPPKKVTLLRKNEKDLVVMGLKTSVCDQPVQGSGRKRDPGAAMLIRKEVA